MTQPEPVPKNAERLRTLLSGAADPNRAKSAQARQISMPVPADRRADEPTLAAIGELLQARPELQGNVMARTGLGSIRLIMILPRLLLDRACAYGPDDAVRWLEKLLATRQATVLSIMPLWGLDVSEPVILNPIVRLLPLAELPGFPSGELESWSFNFLAPTYTMHPPKTALVARHTLYQFLHDAEMDSVPHDASVDELLHEIMLCLTLVAPCAIVPAAQWYQFEDRDYAELARWSGRHWRAQELQPTILRSFGPFNPNRARTLVQSYLALDASTRARIRLALDRFDRSMRRHNPGDAAMELAIGLDSLLGDGEGELTWKVSLRSALLVAGTKSERRKRRAIIQAVYRLRSKVAHIGNAPATIEMRGHGKLSPTGLIPQATTETAAVITAVIQLGKLPDWFDEELGSEYPATPVPDAD